MAPPDPMMVLELIPMCCHPGMACCHTTAASASSLSLTSYTGHRLMLLASVELV